MILIPKNWSEFQHYKDRMPPWIKLHKSLLDDRTFMTLPVASKALAPLLWLLASEDKDGKFDADIEELSFRLRMSVDDIKEGLTPLFDRGFFLDASTLLAPCKQIAVPETETETETKEDIPQNEFAEQPDEPEEFYLTKKKRKLKGKRLTSFLKFWEAFNYKKDKASAADSWLDVPELTDKLVNEICEAAKKEAQNRPAKINSGQTPIFAQGWLTARRWEDEDNQGSTANDNGNEKARKQAQKTAEKFGL